jgi:phage shock protein A
MCTPERFKNLHNLYKNYIKATYSEGLQKIDDTYHLLYDELNKLDQEYQKIERKNARRLVFIVQANNALEYHKKQIELLQNELEDVINE